MQIFHKSLKERGEDRLAHELPVPELAKHITNFLSCARRQDGKIYEPTNLQSFVSSIDRFVRGNGRNISITRDEEFLECRQELKRMKLKCESIHGKKKSVHLRNKLSQEDLDLIVQLGVIGGGSPTALQDFMWFLLVTRFRLKYSMELYKLYWGDLFLKTDDKGNEYLTYKRYRWRSSERQSERVYAETDSEIGDPVSLFKKYTEKRPKSMCYPDSPFFLRVRSDVKISDEGSWYQPHRMGQNKIQRIPKDMKLEAQHLLKRKSHKSDRKRSLNSTETRENDSSLNEEQRMNSLKEGDGCEIPDKTGRLSVLHLLQDKNVSQNHSIIFQTAEDGKDVADNDVGTLEKSQSRQDIDACFQKQTENYGKDWKSKLTSDVFDVVQNEKMLNGHEVQTSGFNSVRDVGVCSLKKTDDQIKTYTATPISSECISSSNTTTTFTSRGNAIKNSYGNAKGVKNSANTVSNIMRLRRIITPTGLSYIHVSQFNNNMPEDQSKKPQDAKIEKGNNQRSNDFGRQLSSYFVGSDQVVNGSFGDTMNYVDADLRKTHSIVHGNFDQRSNTVTDSAKTVDTIFGNEYPMLHEHGDQQVNTATHIRNTSGVLTYYSPGTHTHENDYRNELKSDNEVPLPSFLTRNTNFGSTLKQESGVSPLEYANPVEEMRNSHMTDPLGIVKIKQEPMDV